MHKQEQMLQVHSQTLKAISPCKDGEVLHHAGPTQHPETHTMTNGKITSKELQSTSQN